MVCARDGITIKKDEKFIKTMVGDKEVYFHAKGCFDEKTQRAIPVKKESKNVHTND